MITLRVELPYGSFRKSYARSFAETYPLPPPATIYGMLLSLVAERFRQRHVGVRLAFAYKQIPRIATTLRKLSRYKYGVPKKQAKLGNAPDFIERSAGSRLVNGRVSHAAGIISHLARQVSSRVSKESHRIDAELA